MARRPDPMVPVRFQREMQRMDDELRQEIDIRRPGPAGNAGPAGPAGVAGSNGATGPSSKVALGTLTVSQTAIIVISAGVRTITFTGVTGSLAGDDLLLFPASALPAGYAIHNVRCPASGTVEVTMTAPLLAIGASFSIPCRLVALR